MFHCIEMHSVHVRAYISVQKHNYLRTGVQKKRVYFTGWQWNGWLQQKWMTTSRQRIFALLVHLHDACLCTYMYVYLTTNPGYIGCNIHKRAARAVLGIPNVCVHVNVQKTITCILHWVAVEWPGWLKKKCMSRR